MVEKMVSMRDVMMVALKALMMVAMMV